MVREPSPVPVKSRRVQVAAVFLVAGLLALGLGLRWGRSGQVAAPRPADPAEIAAGTGIAERSPSRAGERPSTSELVQGSAAPSARVGVPSGAGLVHGSVVDDAGVPIVGAEISVYPRPFYMFAGVQAGQPFRRLEVAETDADGRYEVPVPDSEGLYGVVARAAGFARHAMNQEPGVDLEFQLGPAARLEGRALDNGRPIEGVRVFVPRVGWDGDAYEADVVFTDEAGRFAFEELPLGSVVALGVFRPGVLPFNLSVKLSSATNVRDVALGEGFELHGRVVDLESGLPLPDATVDLGPLKLRASDTGSFQCRVEGEPALAEQGEGAEPTSGHFLVAWTPGYCATRMVVGLLEARERVVVVPLQRAGSIRGRVVLASGEPAAGAIVGWFADPDVPLDRGGWERGRIGPSARSSRVVANSQGDFELREVVPNLPESALLVRHPAAADRVVGSVSPEGAGVTRELDVVLGTGLSIQGQVYELGRETAAVVQLQSRDGSAPARTTRAAAADGRYAFDGLEPGAYRVRARLVDAEDAWGKWTSGSVGPQSWTRADVYVPPRKARLGGRLLDHELRPLVGTLFWVAELGEAGSAVPESDVGRGRADAEGRFDIAVDVRGPECFALCTRWGSTTLEWTGQCLDRGWSRTGLELVLPELVELELQVTRGDTGEPARDAEVRWRRGGPDLAGQWEAPLEWMTQSGRARGRVPAGRVEVIVDAPGLAETRVNLQGDEVGPVRVVLWP